MHKLHNYLCIQVTNCRRENKYMASVCFWSYNFKPHTHSIKHQHFSSKWNFKRKFDKIFVTWMYIRWWKWVDAKFYLCVTYHSLQLDTWRKYCILASYSHHGYSVRYLQWPVRCIGAEFVHLRPEFYRQAIYHYKTIVDNMHRHSLVPIRKWTKSFDLKIKPYRTQGQCPTNFYHWIVTYL